MMKTLLCAVLLTTLSAAGIAAPKQPTPPVPKPADTPDEQAVSFWVKFDDLPSEGEPTGLLGCKADKKGVVTVTWKALPTEIVGNLEMTSRDRIDDDEWHHIEVNFSMMQQRATFYMDGKFQWENDNLNVPHLARQAVSAPSADFEGEVKDLRTWTYAADSERMAVARPKRLAETLATAKADLAAAKAAAPQAKGLVAWTDALAKRADELLAPLPRGALPKTSVKEMKDLARDAAHARKFAEAGVPAALFDGAGAVVVPPFSQDPICPYDFPLYGKVGAEARLLAAPGEYEAASFVLTAFRPLQVKSVGCTELKGPKGEKIPAANVDVKLVKRWYRSGSAWIAYHNDRRLRVLVPDLLVNDDSLVYVDE